tara:strand:+ start:1124 stop:1333 length:210 start_codon:yes stop_codon:yes gene_type:complete
MPRDYKQENKDLKVQRADLWKELANYKERAYEETKRANRYKARFYNLKKKIIDLSTITSSSLDNDSDSD